MNFEIKNQPIDDLIKGFRFYPLMRRQIEIAALEKSDLLEKKRRLFEAEYQDVLSYLYYGYIHDCLPEYLDRCKSDALDGSCMTTIFETKEARRMSMYNICNTLAKLDLTIISGSTQLVRLYDQITTYIENNSRESGKDCVVLDVDFWMLYFDFYEKYHSAKNNAESDS